MHVCVYTHVCVHVMCVCYVCLLVSSCVHVYLSVFPWVLEPWNYNTYSRLWKSTKFWKSFGKSMYSYERIFSSGENTSGTLPMQGSFGLCYLSFKEAEELIKGY